MTPNPGLEAAIAAGVIDRATAERLRPYLAANDVPSEASDPDDEKLRLVTGFNDIFVTIGLLMFLGALYYLLHSALVVAPAAWALAEYFTRQRRMALPSIVLLVVFVGAVFLGVLSLVDGGLAGGWLVGVTPSQTLLAALAAAVAAVLHWLRFRVPITVAAGVAALAGIVFALCQMQAPQLLVDHPVAVFLPVGLAIFALAMWFDMWDLKRQTRRTDIAFWLHLLAAPIIVHPILLSMAGNTSSLAGAGQVLLVFLVLAVVALVVDRRAILVSSLLYLAYAAGTLIAAAGIGSSSPGLATLAVGAVVLLLSAAWRPLRRMVMGLVPAALCARLPAVA